MGRFVQFLRRQIDIDLELHSQARQDEETGNAPHRCLIGPLRGFRECELKTRLLTQHHHCGSGQGPCDTLGNSYPREDERGCPTLALLGLPYTDRPGYAQRWRP
ncbi:DUF6221 family protein [Saccharopolyspora mangrovi]|uniref:DUF6221 family protein n=1 Tax=Saccharopolyspora mangrovi TaxID=3082379 RepID=A0ABU6AH49_9PSEU|nr:DUF6221 family protein [Saccharopolyspora sp. S2-29]MEB3370879.1 DUF6221 family protein [Saccharopolyspora sp. S2-29]